jgi:transposase
VRIKALVHARLVAEKDPEILRRAALLLESENRVLSARLAELLAELSALKGETSAAQLVIQGLEEQIAKLAKKVFGHSSERSTRETGKDDEAQEKKPRRGHGPTAQPDLPSIDVVHDLDEPDKTCPSCGGGLEEMEGQTEDSPEIDVIPTRFVIKNHRRKKYRCACGGCVETAPGPEKFVPGGRYSMGFAVHVAVSKYCDHLPLERQVRMMGREGLTVTSQTLWDQIEALERVVGAAHTRLLAHVLSHAVVGADETTWELLGKKNPQKKAWYVWALQVPTAAYYVLKDGRSWKHAEKLLADYSGVLMCDGYDAYIAVAKRYPRVVLAHCWSHVRRGFVEIASFFPAACGEIVDLIGELYAIERQAPRGPAGDDPRRELRDRESRLVIERIVEWVWRTAPTCLPESGLRKAMGYMVNMWGGLVLFLDDPHVPLDNNGTERAVRGVVTGRKNHYGSRSERGTAVAATLYSLVESAKLNALEPRFYLRVAVRAGLRGEEVPLPHEVKAALDAGTLDVADFDDGTAALVAAAIESAHDAAAAIVDAI